ncbi:MAG: GTP-binding protein, partial [Bacteroidaceae bacterium]|nr:GTP-binding protein [Bacteroidaceae bacterium]
MTMNKVPVLLLTGYLGSGKTTLLNRILNNRRGIRFAVIVNDIGEVNIDASLIQKDGVVNQTDDSLAPLQNGCICCTLKMDLVEQLHDIVSTGKFDYIVIEASGICEPAPIAQTICSIPTMGPQYTEGGVPELDCIATVVDALRMKDEFAGGNDLLKANIDEEDIENLVIQQIEFCNLIILNKASEVSKEDLGRIRSVITHLQPHARIVECDYGDVDFDDLLHTGLFDFEKVATSAAWIEALEGHEEDDDDDYDDDDDDDHDHHHHEEHEHHHH